MLLLVGLGSPAAVRAQATPNKGFYHKGSGAPRCDQGELDRLRKDVANLQNQARDIQAGKRAAELKLDTVRLDRIYGWNGSILHLTNAIVKIGAEYDETAWGKVIGVASDVAGFAQATASGYETGPTVENGLNWLGQTMKLCSGIDSCWQTSTILNGRTYGQALNDLQQQWQDRTGNEVLGYGDSQQYAHDVANLDESYEEATKENGEKVNKALSWLFLAVNAQEFADQLKDAAELGDEIDRLQQRWNTIDAQINSDLDKIAPLVTACGGKSTSSALPTLEPRERDRPRVALASIAPQFALFAMLRRSEQSPANRPDTARAFLYRDALADVQEMIATITDGQARIGSRVMPVLSLFVGRSLWRRVDRHVLLGALRGAKPDMEAADRDFRHALDYGQRVIREMGAGADLGTIDHGKAAVTPLALNATVSFSDTKAERHVMKLLAIGLDQRHARLEVQSTPQLLDLAVGDSATVVLDRWGLRRMRVSLPAAYPFGVVLLGLRALPPHVLVDLDATTLAIVLVVLGVVTGAFLLGYTRRPRRDARTSDGQ
jgi:hypothetical protein